MTTIPLLNLIPALCLVLVVLIIYWKWSLSPMSIVYATSRMVSQLILIGFVLNYIFSESNPLWTSLLLFVMISVASWIALRPIKNNRSKLIWKSLLAILLGGTLTLYVIVVFVVQPEHWYEPRIILPLAGMIYANGMNAVSLAADRYYLELNSGHTFKQARSQALNTSLIPITNAFFAVGLVSLPGMMTGQILAGISPLIAVRYQIMVMCMVFCAAGLSSAIFLTLLSYKQKELKQQ